MRRNKAFYIILFFISLCLFFICTSFAAPPSLLFSPSANATLTADRWIDEFDNVYTRASDYANEMGIDTATVTTLTGNFTGTALTATTITGDIINHTQTITTSDEPANCTNIKYLPAWTVVNTSNSPYTVSAGDNLLIDTTGGVVYLNTPTPANGDIFTIVDTHEWFGTNNLLINPQEYYITVSSGTTSTTAINYSLSTTFIYINADGGTPGWIPVNYGYWNN